MTRQQASARHSQKLLCYYARKRLWMIVPGGIARYKAERKRILQKRRKAQEQAQ